MIYVNNITIELILGFISKSSYDPGTVSDTFPVPCPIPDINIIYGPGDPTNFTVSNAFPNAPL